MSSFFPLTLFTDFKSWNFKFIVGSWTKNKNKNKPSILIFSSSCGPNPPSYQAGRFLTCWDKTPRQQQILSRIFSCTASTSWALLADCHKRFSRQTEWARLPEFCKTRRGQDVFRNHRKDIKVFYENMWLFKKTFVCCKENHADVTMHRASAHVVHTGPTASPVLWRTKGTQVKRTWLVAAMLRSSSPTPPTHCHCLRY